MINNFLIQLQSKIKNLESKLETALNMKKKISILNELNTLRKQHTELLESKYETINAKKLQITINKLIKLLQQVNLLLILKIVYYYCLVL
jgi:hypothetical protein